MNEGRWTAGQLFQAVARARRQAVSVALEVHGMETLAWSALPCLLDGEETVPDCDEAERLLILCRVVDEHMLTGFSQKDLSIFSNLLLRLLHNLRPDDDLFC